jgi:hypothetical protein
MTTTAREGQEVTTQHSAANKAMEILEAAQREYEETLLNMITKMVEASKDSNKFMFKFAYDEFQLFAKENWHQVDYDIDNKTKKKIQEIFDIENSPTFTMFKYLSLNLDPFMRFAYLEMFIIFICTQYGDLLGQLWISALGVCFFSVSWALYVALHLYMRMELLPDKDKSIAGAVSYYIMLRCFFPKKKTLAAFKAKKKEDE